MTGVDEPGPDHWPDEPDAPAARAWQHPSEVGLAQRGRSDRRRSTFIASGVVLGGLGLLLSGVLLGSSDTLTGATRTTHPDERAAASVAAVSTEGADGVPRVTAGIVLDHDGHLVVDAASITGDPALAVDPSSATAEGIWAKCDEGRPQQVELVGVDPATDLAVLRMPEPAGVPASFAASDPVPGASLQVLDGHEPPAPATASGAVERSATMGALISFGPATATRSFGAVLGAADAAPRSDLRGAAVFDAAGRLRGLVHRPAEQGGTLRVLSADDLRAAAARVLDDQR